jgi:hypothetical protein
MWESLRSFDEHARDGVRRAIPLAVLMFFFQRDGGRDAFWSFFGAYLVLLTTGKTPRLLDTVIGCTIALLATYLLWPRDREDKETGPRPGDVSTRQRGESRGASRSSFRSSSSKRFSISSRSESASFICAA